MAKDQQTENEQAAFSERLRQALQKANVSESPAELMRLLPRFGGAPVSQQAISGWLNGRAMPRQANMRALAKMLSVEPQYLQFGDEGRRIREDRGAWKMNPLDQLAIETFLNLAPLQRKVVRAMIDELSKVKGGDTARAPRRGK